MPHEHARRCPFCNRFYERKGRRGRCFGKERHEFDLYTLRTERGRCKNRRRD